MSPDYIWQEMINTNLFLTHSLVSKGNMRWHVWIWDRKKLKFSREEKNYKGKTCFTKCSLWKIFQLNVKIKKKKSIKPLKLEPCEKSFRLDGKIQSEGFKKVKSFSSNHKRNSSKFRSLHGPQICLAQIAYYTDRDSQDSKGQRFQKDFYQGYN